MLPRLAWICLATLALPSLALAQAEQQIVKAIQARLDANRRNDMATWATFVADDMMAPLEGATRSKDSRIEQQKAWPREVSYWHGPLQDVKVRVDGDIARRRSSYRVLLPAATPRESSSRRMRAAESRTTSIASSARPTAS